MTQLQPGRRSAGPGGGGWGGEGGRTGEGVGGKHEKRKNTHRDTDVAFVKTPVCDYTHSQREVNRQEKTADLQSAAASWWSF